MKTHNSKMKNRILSIALAIGMFPIGWLSSQPVFALSTTNSITQIGISASLFNNENKIINNGTYEIRFALYSKDRGTMDTYPSNTDSGVRLWEETQTVNVKSGLIKAFLGSVVPFPANLNFQTGDYYIGIRIGTDSEMVPRKKLGSVPSAINAQFLQGKAVGTKVGDIVAIGKGGKIDIKSLPTGAGSNQLVLGNDSRLGLDSNSHIQNTDTGTTGISFALGSGTGISGNNFDLKVSNAVATPALRYNGTTATWQFSNDGISFSDFSTGSGSGLSLPLTGGIMTGSITFDPTQTYSGLTLTSNGTGFSTGGGTIEKTLTIKNSLTLEGTDASTLNIGGGGILGSSAYTASTDYLAFNGTAVNASLLENHNAAYFQIAGSYAPVLGADDNYVTDAQLIVIGNTSGTNTGDITLSGQNYLSISGQTITVNAIDLSGSNVTSTLGVGNGGTNTTTIGSAGSIAYSTGTAYAFSVVGTAGQAVVSGGTGTPTFFNPTIGSVVFAGTGGILEQDNTNFFWDNSNKRLGIGTTGPTTLLELYGSGADVVSTLTVADATYDPIMKFRTGASPSVQFSLGVDNSDGGKFKIFSGDGLGGGDEFTIDANGVTSIANLNLGSTTFDTNAGAVTWIDMGVTADATAGTIERYTAQINNNALLTVYSESDGAGGIQNSGVSIGNALLQTGAKFAVTQTKTSVTAGTLYGMYNNVANTGIVTTGTDTTYGNYTSVTRTGATGGTINNYGEYISLTGDTGGTSTNTGLYVTTSGASTNYSALFMGGNVGIGTTSPGQMLTVSGTFSAEGISAIGTVPASNTRLNIGGIQTSTDNAFGLYQGNLTLTPANTWNAFFQYAGGGTVNTGAGNTILQAVGLFAPSFAKSGSGTITTAYGIKVENPTVGTTNYGIYADGTSIFAASTGNVGIGTTTPTGKLNIISTTEQLRLGYNASNYWSSTVGSTGGLTLQGVGTGGSLTLSPTAGKNVNVNLSTTGDFAVNTSQLYVDTSTSNVGIGTTAPTSSFGKSLHLYNDANTGTVASNSYGLIQSLNRNAVLELAGSSSSTNALVFSSTPGTATSRIASEIANSNLIFQTNGTNERMRIDSTGNVGIGTTTPTTLLELYGSGADVVSTLTVADAIYDPMMKFRTGASPSVQFSLGVDNSDGGKFKIFSGDGLSGGDEFTIDANGTTTIANLNLGSATFDTNAGIVSWVDMGVTADATAGTVESYTAQINNNALLTVYAESDGAGGIQNSGVSIGNATLQTGAKFAVTQTKTSVTAGTIYGTYNNVANTGIVTTGTDTTYGNYTSVTRTGATGGTINNYGEYISLTGDTGGTSTNTGLYVTTSGADTNYSALFMGGNVGIGDTTPDHLLDVAGNIGLNTSSYINFGDTDGTTGYGIYDNAGTLQYKNSGGSWANIGSGMAIGGTVTSGTLGSVYFGGTGGALAQDNTNFFWDNSNKRLGIGTTGPTTLLELYGSGADVVSTLTVADAIYDPMMKFRTGASPSVQFSLGVDNSDGGKFKIFSGDGLGGGDEFTIDANGTTTIANLNLGSTTFDTNAGAVTWVDMGVTADATIGTVESYTTKLDGISMFTVYGESDGAGGIQNSGVSIGNYALQTGAKFAVTQTKTSVTAGTIYGMYNNVANTGIVTTGTDTTYGNYTSVTRTGATGGTINNYGEYISLTGDTGGTSTNTGLYVTASGASTNYSALFMGGNVGIGTTSPGKNPTAGREYLTIQGNADGAGTGQGGVLQLGSFVAASANNGNIEWFDIGNTLSSSLRNAYITSGSSGATANNLGSFIAFGTKADGVSGVGTERMRIDSTGNVGIGTTAPLALLHTYSAIASSNIGEATGVGQIRIDNGASALSSAGGLEFKIAGDTNGYGAKIQALNSSGAQLVFANRTASATWVERMRIASTGNVGIGTINPQQKLDVNGTVGINGTQIIDASRNLSNIGTISSGAITGGLYNGQTISSTANFTGSLAVATTLNVTGAGTIQGLTIGKGGGAISSNTALGLSALNANTSGSSNTAVGNLALVSNTTGIWNTANGRGTLYSNVSGSGNTASGVSALYNSGKTVTAGSFVVGAPYTIQSTGSTNFTLIGATNSNVGTVFTATGIGTGTGTASSNTDANSAFGEQALYNNITGVQNSSFGLNSLFSNTTGSSNTVNGVNAAFYNSTGSNNTVSGVNAAFYNSTGYSNTVSGLTALYNNTSGSYNTAIGRDALYDLNITVNDGSGKNTALGYNTGRGIVTGINNTIIGANVTGLASGLSNNIIIADGAGNRRINVDSTGNVGIGTTGPTTLLELYGSGADVVSTLTVADAIYDPMMKFRTGASPSVQFSLGVDNSDGGKFKIFSGDGLSGGDEFTIDANGTTTIANLNLGSTTFDTNAGAVTWVDMGVTADATIGTIESYTAQLNNNPMFTVYGESDGAGGIQNSGVSIGNYTLQTGAKFAVTQLSTSTTAGTIYGMYNNVANTGIVTTGTDTTYGNYTSVTRTGAVGGTINNYGEYISLTGDTGGTSTNTGLYVTTSGASTNYAALFMGGNVGIGTTSPSSLLSVGATSQFQVNTTGDIFASQTTLDGSTTTNGTDTASTTLILTSATNFNIGNYIKVDSTDCITGVNTCYAKITNIATNTLTISPALTWNNASTVTEMHIPEIGGTNLTQTLANRYGRGYFIDGIVTGNGSTYYSDKNINTIGGDFSITGGNVGIGTTTPSSMFSVGATSQFQVNSTGAVTAVGVNGGTGLIQGTGGLNVTGNITMSGSQVGATPMVFEGATNDTITTTFAFVDPTVLSKTITFPNETGTVCTTGSVCSGYQATGSYLTSLSGALLATGATIGATSQIQQFTNGILGGTGVTDILKLQGTSGDGTLTSPAIQALVGNNGATTALTILNNGNVGIGTTNPGAKLEVSGTGAVGAAIYSTDDNWATLTIGDNYLNNWYISKPASSTDLRFSSSGAAIAFTADQGNITTMWGGVGIGTVSPVYGNSLSFGSAGIIGWEDGVTPGTHDNVIGRSGTTGLYASKGFHVGGTSDAGDNNLLVDGNVGIGTADPGTFKLNTVRGAGSDNLLLDSTNGTTYGGSLVWANAGTVSWTAIPVSEDLVFINPSGPKVTFKTSGDVSIAGCLTYNSSTLGSCLSDERVKTNVNGYNSVGLNEIAGLNPVTYQYNGLGGTTADSVVRTGLIAQQVQAVAPGLVHTIYQKLNPTDATTTALLEVDYGALTFGLINATKELNARTSFIASATTTAVMTVDISGNVGIGTTNPANFKLQVAGDVGPDATNTYNLGASGSNWGCLWYNSGSLGTCASDARLKNNISDFSFGDDPLGKIAGLRPRTFSYKSDDSNSLYHGLIAQEVQQVAPELVTTSSDGYFAVKYGDIQWLTLRALQQLNKNVTEKNIQNDTIIASLNLKTDANITTLTGLKTSVDDQLLIASNKIDAITATDVNQDTSIGALEDVQTTHSADIATLQADFIAQTSTISTMQAQIDTLMGFYTNATFSNIILKDASGNVDLLSGNLRAKKITSIDGFVIDTSHSTAPTIGTATLYPVAVDTTPADGKDDYTGLPMTDPVVMARDGKSIVVPTSAVSTGSRIFVTPKMNVNEPLAVTKKNVGVDFTVSLKNTTSDPITFDWLLIEEK